MRGMDHNYNLNVPEDTGDAFAIPDLWQTSSFCKNPSSSLLFTDLEPVEPLEKANSLFKNVEFESALFNIPSLALPTFYDSDAPSEIASSLADVPTKSKPEREDIWLLTDGFVEAKAAKYVSWDGFLNDQFKEPGTAYLSEAGPHVFDAVIEAQRNAVGAVGSISNIFHTDMFSTSLLYLGLGRSSLLFEYDREAKEFQPKLKSFRISGFTVDTIQSLTDRFLKCGNNMRMLNDFVEKIYASTVSTPELVALADAISVVLSSLQARLSISPTAIGSLLQLQALFHNPSLVLACFADIVSMAASANANQQFLSALYIKIQQLEYKSGWLRDILLDVLGRVSAPWLEFVGGWIGLQRETGVDMDRESETGRFVRVEPKASIDDKGWETNEVDYEYEEKYMPAFITPEDAQTIFETGKALRILKKHHPMHPLARPGIVPGVKAPDLEWKFSWQDVENIEAKAKAYERSLAAAIRRFGRKGIAEDPVPLDSAPKQAEEFEIFGKTEDEIKNVISSSAEAMDQPLSSYDELPRDTLRSRIFTVSSSDAFSAHNNLSALAPPISLTPILSFDPIFSAQARLVNSSCVRLFFKEHNLRSHISLQRKFHLFGDGVFTSRLSHALFDTELETAEHRKGVTRSGGTMGLKLGSRDTWPPASSELRLALMGVLSDSYHSSVKPSGSHNTSSFLSSDTLGELPGGLSFAVREISPDELARCMDPNNIEALDFLRLQYKPPPPLDAIITPSTLFKYDKLFKFLLRLIRMLHVVNQLFRDDRTTHQHRERPQTTTERGDPASDNDPLRRRFRIEAHHFVSCVSNYIFEVGVGQTWARFEAKLDEVERRLDVDEEAGHVGGGLERLREFHERVLDRMLFATMLRKRQEQVMKLLEEVFGAVLTFARSERARASLGQEGAGLSAEGLGEVYARFRKRVGVFVGVCRGLSERRGYGHKDAGAASEELFGREGGSEDGGNTISLLLLRLEMSGYYSQPVGRV